jgi:hypothetical protein
LELRLADERRRKRGKVLAAALMIVVVGLAGFFLVRML